MKRPMAWMGCLVLIFTLFFMCLRPVGLKDPPAGTDANITMTGVLTDRQYKNNSYVLRLADVYMTDHAYSGNDKNQKLQKYAGVQVWLEKASYEELPMIGEKIEVCGKAENFSEASNPGEFDMRRYYYIHGTDFCIFNAKVQRRTGHGSILRDTIQRLKERMLLVFDTNLPENEAGILKAMILGDRASLTDEMRGLYQRNGLAHALSISGLHISILGYGTYRLLKKYHAGSIISVILTASLVIFYAELTGGGISVLRALTMFLVCLGADIANRTYDMLSALSASLILILLLNPLIVYDAGFMLSFGAVLGICMVNPWLENYFPKKDGLIGKLLSSISVSLSIQIFTLPIVLYFFYQIPLTSIPLNLLMIPLMGLLIVSAILLALLGIVSWFPVFPFVLSCRIILRIYETGCRICDTIPGGVFIAGRPSMKKVIIYYLVLLLVITGTSVKGLKKKEYAAVKNITGLLILALSVMMLVLKPVSGLTITMFDIGQGDSILVRTSAGTTYLIDCGSTTEKEIARYRVIPAMKSMGLHRIDYCIMTHPDKDHISGFEEMFEMPPEERLPIKYFVMPDIKDTGDAYRTIESEAQKAGAEVLKISDGQCFRDGETEILCIHPGKDFRAEDVNEYSVVLELKYRKFKALFTGDIQGDGESRIIRKLDKEGPVSILKVAHHGSKNSTPDELLDELHPAVALISAGENNTYGHPHRDTIERLNRIHTKIVTTIESGAITVNTDGEKMEIKSYEKK